MAARQERAFTRQERILDAALDVFAEHGYQQATVDDIASTAQTSKGGIYFHFPGKDAIFLYMETPRNHSNMAFVGVFTGYAVARAMRPLARRSRAGLLTTSFVAALVNTVAAALAFVVEYTIGGAGGAGLGTVFTLMVGLHVLIGIGEGVITAATVGAVAAARPDLVYLLREPAPVVRTTGEGVAP